MSHDIFLRSAFRGRLRFFTNGQHKRISMTTCISTSCCTLTSYLLARHCKEQDRRLKTSIPLGAGFDGRLVHFVTTCPSALTGSGLRRQGQWQQYKPLLSAFQMYIEYVSLNTSWSAEYCTRAVAFWERSVSRSAVKSIASGARHPLKEASTHFLCSSACILRIYFTPAVQLFAFRLPVQRALHELRISSNLDTSVHCMLGDLASLRSH